MNSNNINRKYNRVTPDTKTRIIQEIQNRGYYIYAENKMEYGSIPALAKQFLLSVSSISRICNKLKPAHLQQYKPKPKKKINTNHNLSSQQSSLSGGDMVVSDGAKRGRPTKLTELTRTHFNVIGQRFVDRHILATGRGMSFALWWTANEDPDMAEIVISKSTAHNYLKRLATKHRMRYVLQRIKTEKNKHNKYPFEWFSPDYYWLDNIGYNKYILLWDDLILPQAPLHYKYNSEYERYSPYYEQGGGYKSFLYYCEIDQCCDKHKHLSDSNICQWCEENDISLPLDLQGEELLLLSGHNLEGYDFELDRRRWKDNNKINFHNNASDFPQLLSLQERQQIMFECNNSAGGGGSSSNNAVQQRVNDGRYMDTNRIVSVGGKVVDRMYASLFATLKSSADVCENAAEW